MVSRTSKVLEPDTREPQRLGLSGVQKVNLVVLSKILSASATTWRRHHIMCLDEPTNYLHRESLAAVIEARWGLILNSYDLRIFVSLSSTVKDSDNA
ncbi:hypothetical protein BYT27DRAFT_7337382 [Phlegmacium glaucopus]|nr:hypothetical protein BYT27DRAFT_7337382 [Phlegmacium glaucopus]